MAPIEQRYAEADEIASWGVSSAARFAPIPCPLPDERSPNRRVPNLIDALATLPTSRLVELGRELRARMLGSEFTKQDFAIVSAMVQRLESK